jgi:HEPN domain-containing protein
MINSIGSVTINALGVELQFQSDELTSDRTIDQATSLDKELNVWASRLRGWLSVLAQGPTGYVFELGIVTWPAGIQSEMQSDAYAAGRLYEPRQVSEWQWKHALAHSANGDSPLAARSLLATAATNAYEENYRTAVLDAATAAELSLAKGVANKVEIHGADKKLSELLLRNKTLGALIQLARDFNLTLPPDVDKNLVKKRNNVTHQGYIPTREDASEAIRVAQAIVATLDPFPIHCDEEADYLGIQGISEDD